jgi:hypothetical protein
MNHPQHPPCAELLEEIMEADAAKALIVKLQAAGHHVHHDRAGGFIVTKWNMSRHCLDFESLIQFCRQLGISPMMPKQGSAHA